MAEITLDVLKQCTLRMSIHFDGPRGPKGFFGDVHQCIQFPRLQRKTTYWRATRSATVEWRVDGVAVGDKLEDAIPALNLPPALTEAETEALKLFTDEWQDLRKAISYETSRALRDKGVIEAERGRSRLRQARP